MSCSGGAVSFLRIPSNIKQEFAPFQTAKGGGMQTFSFRPSRLKGGATAGLLNMVPSSVSQNTNLFTEDISYWYGAKDYLTFNDMLDLIPCVQIREYLPDTKLDQSLNFFQDLFTSIFKGKKEKEKADPGNETDYTEAKSKDLMEKLKNVVDKVMEKIDSTGWMNSICGGTDIDSMCAGADQKTLSVVKFPYFLYYKLQSCLTTNIYELPCVPSNNAMYSSDGHPGWEGSSGMRLLPDFAKNIPILGKMLDTLFGNMGINFTPWWDAANGSQTKGSEIECKFSLFNDNVDSAAANFIFVTTLIAHCRWVQYNIMQHSSSLYDVTIPGIGKTYACMGSFDVQYKGTLRVPSGKLFDKLRGSVGSKYVKSIVVNDQQIKIPDVYDVTMKFQPLLPANFNTFVYNFMEGNIESFQSQPSQPSGFKKLTDAIDQLKEIAKSAW